MVHHEQGEDMYHCPHSIGGETEADSDTSFSKSPDLACQDQASCTNHHCKTPTGYNEPIGIPFTLVNYEFIKTMGFISSIMQRIYKMGEASTKFATRH